MRVVGALLALLTITATLAARDNTLSPAEVQQGWILLFDGESLYGWTSQGGAQWRVESGTILAESGESGSLRTNSSFADFDLTCDFLIKTDGASGIFLRTDKGGDPEAAGYKLQINNKDAKFPTGSLVGQVKASTASVSPNQWHSYSVEAVGDHFVVKLDGNVVLSGDGHKNKVGRIGLQYVPGTPVQFRNLKLRPLGLGDIFNGKNLYQWSEVGAQAPGKKGVIKKLIPVGGSGHPSDWSIESGAIHVKKGPSELESGPAYDDFILQVDAQADSHKSKEHSSGGIYVRADKASPHTGYEVQIHNEYLGNDPTKPKGVGTGGLASMHARRIVSADNQFFKLTVAACGHHISTWVNGYQTADYEDTRADGPDALIQARTLAGPIRLAADDPSSSLDFKSIEVVTLPKAGPAMMASQPPTGAPGAGQAPTVIPPTGLPPTMAMPGGPAVAAGNPHQKEIDGLLQQAFVTADPEKQIENYNRVLLLDNNNQAAISGRSQAQAKLDQIKAQQTQTDQQKAAEEAAAKQRQEQASADETTKADEINQTKAAILAGNLAGAAAHIAIAKKIAPLDPMVLELDSLVQSKRQAQRRERWLGIGLGSIGFVGLCTLLVMNLRKRQPCLEIVEGMDMGKRFSLDQDVMHIGAVAQDGGRKNEIVVTDLDHLISRFHCEVHRHNGKFWLLDCNSANGTFLNGHRILPDTPVLLKKGGRLQLAEACTLRLRFEKSKAKDS
ncbi:MAG: family 16 glycoside hydrolase [Terriglobia bacterium]